MLRRRVQVNVCSGSHRDLSIAPRGGLSKRCSCPLPVRMVFEVTAKQFVSGWSDLHRIRPVSSVSARFNRALLPLSIGRRGISSTRPGVTARPFSIPRLARVDHGSRITAIPRSPVVISPVASNRESPTATRVAAPMVHHTHSELSGPDNATHAGTTQNSPPAPRAPPAPCSHGDRARRGCWCGARPVWW